jgi:hypothetical protein
MPHFCIFFSLGGFIARLEPSSSGSLAIFAAIRRASSQLERCLILFSGRSATRASDAVGGGSKYGRL